MEKIRRTDRVKNEVLYKGWDERLTGVVATGVGLPSETR